jgi:4-amino-4-deoxy-L-arabinose transferase-like glycosyltransferase
MADWNRNRMQKKSTAIFLIALTFAALGMRWSFMTETQISRPIRADAEDYAIYAFNLTQHGVYSQEVSDAPKPDSYRSPGFPFMIASAFYLGGGKKEPYDLVIWIQIVLGALMVPLTYWWASRMLPGLSAGLASMLVALSPHLIAINSYFLTESLFAFLLLFAMAGFAKAWESENRIWFGVAGMLLGLAYLTNETALLLPPILIFVCVAYSRCSKGRWPARQIKLRLCVFFLVFALFPSGWALRNSMALDSEARRGSHRALAALSQGTYPDFFHETLEYKYYPYREDPLQPEFASSAGRFWEILSGRVAERPLRYLTWYVFEKPYYFWSWDNLQSQHGTHQEAGRGDVYVYPVKESWYEKSIWGGATRAFMWALHPFLLVLALIGIPLLISAIRGGRLAEWRVYEWILFAVLIYYTTFYSLFESLPRYSVPFRPELYVWCMLVIQLVWQRKTLAGPQSARNSN